MLLPARSSPGVRFSPEAEEVPRLGSCPGNGEGPVGSRCAMDGDVGRVCCWQGGPGAKLAGVSRAPGLFWAALWLWRSV